MSYRFISLFMLMLNSICSAQENNEDGGFSFGVDFGVGATIVQNEDSQSFFGVDRSLNYLVHHRVSEKIDLVSGLNLNLTSYYNDISRQNFSHSFIGLPFLVRFKRQKEKSSITPFVDCGISFNKTAFVSTNILRDNTYESWNGYTVSFNAALGAYIGSAFYIRAYYEDAFVSTIDKSNSRLKFVNMGISLGHKFSL